MSKTARWLLVVVIAVAIAGALIWPKFRRQPKPLVLVAMPTSSNPFWQELINGIREKAAPVSDSIEVRIKAGTEDTDDKQQIADMNAYLNVEGVRALILGPASSTSVIPTVAEFNKRSIPVIVVDSKLAPAELSRSSAHVDLFIGSQNEQGGVLAAQRLDELLGPGSHRVLLVAGAAQHETAIARSSGFRKGASPSWSIEERPGQWSRTEANRIMRATLQQLPDGVFAASDEMALGVIEALENGNIDPKRWPAIVGFDATSDGLKAIQAGKMCATVAQQPGEIGRQAMAAAVDSVREPATFPHGQEKLVEVKIIPEQFSPCARR